MTSSSRSTPRFRNIIFIILAAALVYLAGNWSVCLWDRDEPRYAQTSKQMLESGDWVVPRLLDQVRTAKPIFIYWCQAAAMKAYGATVFAARLPSVIAMLLTLLVVGIVVRKLIGPRRAFWTVLVLASAAMSIAAAKMCLTDGVLLLFVTSAQICLAILYVNRDERHPLPHAQDGSSERTGATDGHAALVGHATLSRGAQSFVSLLMWVAIGFAGLTKGPVVIGVQLMTMALLAIADRKTIGIGWWKRTRPLIGVFIVASICGPWLWLIHSREPSFLPTVIGHDVVQRMSSGLEGHKGPPGYYLLTIWGTYFPWSILLPATLFAAWKRRRIAIVRFCLAAVVGPWILFELVQTKLPHYILPTFPPLAFLTADVIARSRKLKRQSVWLGFGTLSAVAIVYTLVVPRIAALRVSKHVAATLVDQGATHLGDAIMIDYKETSLAFYQGGTIRPQRDNAFLLSTPPEQWPKWVVLTGDIWAKTPADVKDRFDVIRSVHGWNYADGLRVVDVLVLRKK